MAFQVGYLFGVASQMVDSQVLLYMRCSSRDWLLVQPPRAGAEMAMGARLFEPRLLPNNAA
jgi:hypothetical protein